MYSVMKFLSDKTVSAVPSSWLSLENSMCSWCSGLPGAVASAIKKSKPPQENWPKYYVKYFASAGNSGYIINVVINNFTNISKL